MKTDLLNKPVLAMYDVRGIQSYIFKSNKAKEIIGASILVADVITKGLNCYVYDKVSEDKRWLYKTDWQTEKEIEFLNDEDIQMQVMFVGGGNSYVLFRIRFFSKSPLFASSLKRYLNQRLIDDNSYLILLIPQPFTIQHEILFLIGSNDNFIVIS